MVCSICVIKERKKERKKKKKILLTSLLVSHHAPSPPLQPLQPFFPKSSPERERGPTWISNSSTTTGRKGGGDVQGNVPYWLQHLPAPGGPGGDGPNAKDLATVHPITNPIIQAHCMLVLALEPWCLSEPSLKVATDFEKRCLRSVPTSV